MSQRGPNRIPRGSQPDPWDGRETRQVGHRRAMWDMRARRPFSRVSHLLHFPAATALEESMEYGLVQTEGVRSPRYAWCRDSETCDPPFPANAHLDSPDGPLSTKRPTMLLRMRRQKVGGKIGGFLAIAGRPG